MHPPRRKLEVPRGGGPTSRETLERNKSLVRRFYHEVFEHGRLSSIDDLVGEPAVDHEELPGATGDLKADLKAWVTAMHAAFPDLRIDLEDLVAEDDEVAARAVLTGTHRGELMGMPPSGRFVRMDMIDIVRIRDGRIVEHWGVADGSALAASMQAGV